MQLLVATSKRIVGIMAILLLAIPTLGRSFNLFRPVSELSSQAGVGMIDVLVYVLLASAIIPLAIATIVDVDTSSWDATSVLIWAILPVLIVIGVLYYLWRAAKGGVGD
jgi:hypothetical protein